MTVPPDRRLRGGKRVTVGERAFTAELRVPRDLSGASRLGARRSEQLERQSDGAVHLAPPRGGDALPHDSRNDGMRGAVRPVFLRYQVPLNQPVDHRGRAEARDAVHVREEIGPAAPARERDRDQQIVEIGRKRFDALRDGIVRRRRHGDLRRTAGRRRGQPLARPGVDREPALREQRAEQLDHV